MKRRGKLWTTVMLLGVAWAWGSLGMNTQYLHSCGLVFSSDDIPFDFEIEENKTEIVKANLLLKTDLIKEKEKDMKNDKEQNLDQIVGNVKQKEKEEDNNQEQEKDNVIENKKQKSQVKDNLYSGYTRIEKPKACPDLIVITCRPNQRVPNIQMLSNIRQDLPWLNRTRLIVAISNEGEASFVEIEAHLQSVAKPE
ncbi:MAG: hypothetical protein EZS28_006640 [Streblomastix strix]|uniref:Uncharacterized protein n=1 Tax=Streblomastix strix TaxID=222440 RepID=A0A5J4WRW4_9EUKA|nr:MAG: hypothetical protein EZS28_006640 [Streblomastix strix]